MKIQKLEFRKKHNKKQNGKNLNLNVPMNKTNRKQKSVAKYTDRQKGLKIF